MKLLVEAVQKRLGISQEVMAFHMGINSYIIKGWKERGGFSNRTKTYTKRVFSAMVVNALRDCFEDGDWDDYANIMWLARLGDIDLCLAAPKDPTNAFTGRFLVDWEFANKLKYFTGKRRFDAFILARNSPGKRFVVPPACENTLALAAA